MCKHGAVIASSTVMTHLGREEPNNVYGAIVKVCVCYGS
jgi:hypothetical protein